METGETIRVISQSIQSDDRIVVYPIGDLHIGDPTAKIDLFTSLVERVKSSNSEYLILLGDLVNNGIKSSVTNVYNEIIPPGEQKRLAVELLRPVSQKIIGFVSGNHEYRTKKEVDQDISFDIALALGVEDRYDPHHLLIDLQVGKSRYILYVFHGHSATRLPGGTLNAYQYVQLNVFGVDIYIHGHSHYPYVMPYSTFFYAHNNRKVQQKTFYDISVSPWTTWSGYAIRKQMRPRPILPVVIELEAKRKKIKVFFENSINT